MALPKRISEIRIKRIVNDDLCMQCGGPGLADMDTNPNWEGDTFYIVEGDPFCSISCIEDWHGISLS
jgi:hypothetical protein